MSVISLCPRSWWGEQSNNKNFFVEHDISGRSFISCSRKSWQNHRYFMTTESLNNSQTLYMVVSPSVMYSISTTSPILQISDSRSEYSRTIFEALRLASRSLSERLRKDIEKPGILGLYDFVMFVITNLIPLWKQIPPWAAQTALFFDFVFLVDRDSVRFHSTALTPMTEVPLFLLRRESTSLFLWDECYMTVNPHQVCPLLVGILFPLGRLHWHELLSEWMRSMHIGADTTVAYLTVKPERRSHICRLSGVKSKEEARIELGLKSGAADRKVSDVSFNC